MQARGVLITTAMVMLAGCASQRTAQEIGRLRSDVGVLDQRVGQLERASLKPPSATEWPSEPQASTSPSATTPPAGSNEALSALKPSGSAHPGKPSKKEIQQALKNAGFYQGSVDGRIGPRTRDAVMEFQRVQGLKVDGVVGRQTWEKLFPYLGQASVESGDLHAARTLK